MSDIQRDPTTLRPTRGPLALLGGLALAGAFALAIALSNGLGTSPGGGPVAVNPTPSENPAAGGGVASCLMYDPANLPTFDTVFDGTVTAVDGDQITFDVNEGWKGVDGSVTLTAPAGRRRAHRPAARLRGRWPLPRHRRRLDDQLVRLHARLRRRHGSRLGGRLLTVDPPRSATRPRHSTGSRDSGPFPRASR